MTITFTANGEPVATLETEKDISFEAASAIAAVLSGDLGVPVVIDVNDL